ncbi:MAG TPA: alpha-glucan family phosphorylase [Gammaproteobacteria bacterium]|nr:alpha-glucan family phosphorylase [Gammaproteobacteria bacterium]
MNPERYLPRALPAALEGLAELAVDLRWSWNHSADALWEAVDADLWRSTGNPWLILESVSRRRLDALARDDGFRRELHRQVRHRRAYMDQPAWFDRRHGSASLGPVAYFSMEFGLGEALPIYSGGLGILAGDLLKTASDLGVPVAGVGLLYQQGYFRQALDADGNQLAYFPYNNPTMLPVLPLRDADGEWLRVSVDLPGRRLVVRGWEARVGRTSLYLLDSNDLLNEPGDRGITGELYGGGTELRLQQEMVLGIGGWRLLRALGVDSEICHLNEGHAAFVVLERARNLMQTTGRDFAAALRCTRAGNVFTTHTPVAAGFDRFAPRLMAQYLGRYAGELGLDLSGLLALGRTRPEDDQEPFNMAFLALRGCNRVNGVSAIHGQVSRRLFQPLFPRWPQGEVPVTHVTNGVHVPSWDSAAADTLWTRASGQDRWRNPTEQLERNLRAVGDRELWQVRCDGRRTLVEGVRRRLARQSAARGAEGLSEAAGVLDPDRLVLGFARRFATYKRPNLLLHDPERLVRILTDPRRPAQLILAGKAHPRDEAGRRMVKAWAEFARRPAVRDRVVFLTDYDMALAAELVQGVDLWINTPRRPWEACGTSGMKVLVNGGLNLSELDGWWAEAYTPQRGWALGDGREHDDDPAWDAREAEALYDLLEREVAPAFYDRDDRGVPAEWVSRMRESMAHLTPLFSSNRMVRDYTERYYLPAAEDFRRRAADGARLAVELEDWHRTLIQHWPGVEFGALEADAGGDMWRIRVPLDLNGLDPAWVQVELYADPAPGQDRPVRIPMAREATLSDTHRGHVYAADAPADRPLAHFTPRVVPAHPDARVPLEAALVRWQR